VENALVAYANEQTRWKALNDSVVANRRALEIANELYTTGNGDFLSVLDSERSLFSSEDQLVDSQRLVSEDLVTLYKALGGGWETFQLARNDSQKQAMRPKVSLHQAGMQTAGDLQD